MFVFRNVFIPLEDEWVGRDVLIGQGVYRQIVPPGTVKGVLAIQSEGRYLIPALVDPHVHVRDPGFSHKEDWESCTKAALKGGFTTIFDMPNNRVPVTDEKTLEDKIKVAKEKSYVNFGLYVALTNSNFHALTADTLQHRICGIKVYLAKTTGGITVSSEEALLRVFAQPKPVLVHTGGMDGLLKLLFVYAHAEKMFSRLPVLYICHVSTEEEVKVLRKWKRGYPKLHAEVTPHHLFLNRSNYHGPPGVLPPLEGERDNEALWDGIAEGILQMLGTDHAPHTLEEKMSVNPPSGFPGLETALPLILRAHREKRIGLASLLELTSGRAQRLFRIGEGKGIQPNAPACCVLLSEGRYTVGEDGYATKCGWSPFHGWEYILKPVLTVVNGEIAYEEGGFIKRQVRMLHSCG